MSDLDRMRRVVAEQPPFAELLGLRIVSAEPDRVVGEVTVRTELLNRNGTLHGGAVMAIADNMGGTATSMLLADGQMTSTVESKTNFFAAVPVGDVVRAECTPLHKGRTTMVWQTRIQRGDGRLAALVIQTQIILRASSPIRG